MLDQLDANFRNLSSPELIVTISNIADLLSGHPGFPLPWPDVVPDPDRLRQTVNRYKDCVNAAAHGDRQKIAERNAARADVELNAALTAQYLVMKAIKEKDMDLLQDVGFPLKNRSSKTGTSSVPVGPPANFTAKHGPVSRTLIVKANRVVGPGSYELHMCEGEPTGEECWKNLGLFVRCSRIEVKDLEPGKKYTFRIRCHGVNGPGPWSSNVSIIAL